MMISEMIAENDWNLFKDKVRFGIRCCNDAYSWRLGRVLSKRSASAVLFLLAIDSGRQVGDRLCLVLSKRSEKVRQAGDLCCPGGRVNRVPDSFLATAAAVLAAADKTVSGNSGPVIAKQNRGAGRGQSLLEIIDTKLAFWIMTATALREAWEEIRLNPLNVEILGALPPQPLVMFKKVIFPVAAWMKKKAALRPNWEVSKMIYIPFSLLLNPRAYARFRLPGTSYQDIDFPCVVIEEDCAKELLWGATYRICVNFLKLVFGFEPPPASTLPYVENDLYPGYLSS